ncbi:MAG: hypothetical protein AAF938_17580 [Myxococcota bacterium]
MPLAACDCGGDDPITSCTLPADCGDGRTCVDGRCILEAVPCTSPTDCAPGQSCVDSVCVGGGASCDDDRPCPSGQECIAGMCEEPGCEDTDGDGFGPGCSRGDDCDPNDMLQTGVEICDGRDNDCDGEADNGVLSACGDCDASCRLGGVGVGSDDPFMPDEMNSDGVGVADDGAIELDSRRINTNFIWIANTQEGSVSRFSTTPPYNEVGRYFTGPDVNADANFSGNDPSRTSVNSLGDAIVGNRNGAALARISVLGTDCPDTNGDGVVTTSQDLNGDGIISTNLADGEMIPWDTAADQPGDDCVLWRTRLDTEEGLGLNERLIRAVAAQDVTGLDGELQQFVWAGGYTNNRVVKLNAETGEVIFNTESPRQPYGFAIDAGGKLWISTRQGSFLAFIDTNRCVDAASCSEAKCVATAEGAECDGAIKAEIPAPFVLYGITVDFDQRIWVGGGGMARYDISAPAGSRWAQPTLPFTGGLTVHGIAADAVGFVWGAAQGNGISRVDADSLENTVVVDSTNPTITTVGASNKGMAVDAEGKIWSITQTNEAIVVRPGATLMENAVERGVASSIYRPYTYSDMTGLQLRLATNPRGFYRHIFEACGSEAGAFNPAWGELRFDAETPAGTSVTFRVRTAGTREDLDAQEWITVGMTPPDSPPFDVGAALAEAGVMPGAFLMVEVILEAERSSSIEVVTPRVSAIDVTHTCNPILG